MKAALPIVLAFVFASIVPARSAETTPVAEFTAIEQKMAEALIKGDGPGFAQFVPEDWKIVLTDGKMLTIAEVTAALTAGKLKFRSVKLSDLEVRSYGDTAIVIGINRTMGSWDGEDFDGKDRFTDVFVKKDGAWKCVASHSSTISDE